MKDINEKQAFNADYRYFLTRVRKAHLILAEILENTNLKRESRLKVLAVGGEYGFIEYNLAKWTKWDITTSDIEPKLIYKYPLIKKYVTAKVLDSTNLPYKNHTFDLIIFNHVIEHIPDYTKAVEELHRVLKPKGYMYLATPNLYRKLIHPKLIFKKKKGIDTPNRIAWHLGFSREELECILSKFNIVKNITKEHQSHNLKLLGKITNILPRPIFNRYSQTNVVICRK